MDSTSKIQGSMYAADAVTLALNNLSLIEVPSKEQLCSPKDSATEVTLDIRPDINYNETSRTKPSVMTQNDAKPPSQTQDCALTVLDDHCNLTNNELSPNSTCVVPVGMVNSLRDSVNDKMKIDFVIRQNSHSNSHQQNPRLKSSDCVITLYDSSESSDTSIYDSDETYDSEEADSVEYIEKQFSPVKNKYLNSDEEPTEESSTDSEEDSSDSRKDSSDSGEVSKDNSSDLDSVSINEDSDEEPPSDDEAADDSDEDSATASEEEKPDSEEDSDPCDDNGSSTTESSEGKESSDDDKSVELGESSESPSDSSEDSD